MANIDKELGILEDLSTDGQRARGAIVDAFNLINTQGANATTLQGETADNFISKDDLASKMAIYLRRTGKVHDLKKKLDVDGNPIILSESYKDNIPNTPFDKKKNTTASITVAKDAKYDMTFATGNAVWLILGYSDAADLDDYINS